MNTQRISLDISKRPCVTPVVRIRRGDKFGTSIAVDVTDGGEPFDISGYDATLVAKLPGGGGIVAYGTVSGSTATFPLYEEHLSVGVADLAYVEITDGETQYSTQAFTLAVERSAKE